MKKQKSTSEHLVKQPKIEQPVEVTGSKKMTKKTVTAAKSEAPKPAPKKPVRAVAKSIEDNPVVVTAEMHMHERIGMTAGNIWNYLHDKGATSIGKLVRELTDDEKIIQRSIGWLAKEDKIALSVSDRAEQIALKD